MDEGVNFGKMSRRSQEIVNKAYAAMREAQVRPSGLCYAMLCYAMT